jgi:cytochrome P450
LDHANFGKACEKTVTDARARLEQEKTPNGYYNIIDELLRADLPEYEKKNHRLALEAQGLIGAATETTAWTLSLATFHIYHDREILRKLRSELFSVAPDKRLPSLAKLEALPYFSAIITEAFRHAGGPISRLPRIFPSNATILRSTHNGKPVEYTVPPGTVLSMSSTYIHNNSELFPDPDVFLPERWLDQHGKRKRDREKYLLHFSKGTRGCIGLNLATAELYMCLAALVLQVGEHVDLYKTDLRDVTPEFDNFAMRPYKGSQGIRVVIN